MPSNASPVAAYNGVPSSVQQNFRIRRMERGQVKLRAGVPVSANSGFKALTLGSKVASTALTASAQVAPDNSGFVQRGSVSPAVASPNFTISLTATSAAISWTAYATRRADGTAVTLPAGRVQVNGLAASTSYYVHSYWSDKASQIGFVSGGAGTPPICFTTLDDTSFQKQILASNVDLGVIYFSTPASGTASATTGGMAQGGTGGAGRVSGVVQVIGVSGGQATSASIANGAIGAAALAAAAVTSTAIAAGAVTTSALASGAVTTAKLASGAVSSVVTENQASVALATSLTQVATVTLSADGGNALLFVSAQIANTGASAQNVQLQVYKGTSGGTLLVDSGAFSVAAGLTVPWSVCGLVDSSPASSQQYTVYATIASGSGTLTNLILTALDLKV